MFQHTPSDRVQHRALGELMHPGCCALCGSGNSEEGYVDLGVYFDYEGQVYLCMAACIPQIINLVGALMPDETKFLREVSEQIHQDNVELKAENERISSRLAIYDSVFVAAMRDNYSSLAASYGEEFSEKPDESNADVVVGTSDGESESTESDSVEGSNDSERDELRDRSFTV